MNEFVIFGYVASLLMGLSLGLIGGGGSILTVPILVYFFQLNGVLATGLSLFIVGATALVGAILNAQKKQIDIKTSLIFVIPSLAGVALSRRILLPAFPDSLALLGFSFTKSLFILVAFAILMLLAARAMIRSSHQTAPLTKTQPKIADILLKGFFVGVVTGFVGAGGGFLIVPALVLLLGLPIRKAIGSSLLIITINSFFGFALSLNNLTPDWPLLITVSALGILGLAIGHWLSPRLPEKNLKQGFGYFVLLIGLFVFIDQSRLIF